MALITVDPTKVRVVEVIESYPAAALVAITPGQMVKLDPSTGKVNLALSTTAPNALTIGMALSDTARQPMSPTILRRGIVDLGSALDAMNFGDVVYLNDTGGSIGTAAGTVSKPIGTVVAGYGNTTMDKFLRIDA